MPYTLRVADDRRYITLKFEGTSGRPEFQGVLDAHALGAKLGIRSYLVDLTDAVNPDTATDDYQLAYADFPANTAIDRFAKVVALVSPGDRSHDFLVTVFRNAGFRIDRYEDRAAALRELESGPSPESPR
jgi:hypothetical protein